MKGSVFLGEGAWIVVGKIASAFGMLVTIKILTNSLTLEDYGRLALGLTLCNLITQLIMGALGQAAGRSYIESIELNDVEGFRAALIKLIKKCGLFLFLMFCAIGIADLMLHNGQDLFLLAGLVAFGYLVGINDIANGLQNLARNRKLSAFNANFELWIRIPIVLVLFIFVGKSVGVVIFAYLFSALAALYLQKKCLASLLPKTPSNSQGHNWVGEITSIALPAGFWGIFVWMHQASDKWALGVFQASEEVAKYTVLYQIGYMPVMMGMGVLSTLYAPIIFKHSGTPLAIRTVRNLIAFLGLATVTGIAVAFTWGQIIFEYLVSPHYISQSVYLPLIILAAGIYCIGDTLSMKMMGERKVMSLMQIKILTCI